MAGRLGFFNVDEEIVARAAAKVGIDPGEVDEERRKSRVARVLEAITQGSGEAWALGASRSNSGHRALRLSGTG